MSARLTFIRRLQNEAFNLKYLHINEKHGGGNIMLFTIVNQDTKKISATRIPIYGKS